MKITANKRKVYEHAGEYYETKERLLSGAIERKLKATLLNGQDIRQQGGIVCGL